MLLGGQREGVTFLAKVTSHTPANHYCTVRRIIEDPIEGDDTDEVDIEGVWVASSVDLSQGGGKKVLVARMGIADRPYMALWKDVQAQDESDSEADDCT